jgi:thymidylate synthase ThyX
VGEHFEFTPNLLGEIVAYSARIILDSITEATDRLTTMEVTFPRMVLAEFNTHRMFSRNSASSRAIPFSKQLARIQRDPFIPSYWGANQAGMQASVEISEETRATALQEWTKARDQAIVQAEALHNLGVHKQTVNRLLEPFMWHTVIVTATEWSNFFALRANPDAQPEIRTIAEMMKTVYQDSNPTLLNEGEWHLPFVGYTPPLKQFESRNTWLNAVRESAEEKQWAIANLDTACKVSAARCARVSYLTHENTRDIDKDLELYERLVSGGHMSPLEHVATPYYKTQAEDVGKDDFWMVSRGLWLGNFRGWKQLRKFIANEDNFSQAGKG